MSTIVVPVLLSGILLSLVLLCIRFLSEASMYLFVQVSTLGRFGFIALFMLSAALGVLTLWSLNEALLMDESFTGPAGRSGVMIFVLVFAAIMIKLFAPGRGRASVEVSSKTHLYWAASCLLIGVFLGVLFWRFMSFAPVA